MGALPVFIINTLSLVAISPLAGDSNIHRHVGKKYTNTKSIDAQVWPGNVITVTPTDAIDADFDFKPYKPTQYIACESTNAALANKTVDVSCPASIDTYMTSASTTINHRSKQQADVVKKNYEENFLTQPQTYYGKA